MKFNGEMKVVYAKFIWKKKVNGGLNEGRIGKIIQQYSLSWLESFSKFYAKTTLKRDQRGSIIDHGNVSISFQSNFFFGRAFQSNFIDYALLSF
jgi:hypothetical protein